MKVKQTVSIKMNSVWCGYSGLEITDANDDCVNVDLSQDQWLELEDKIIAKCDLIRERRAEQAAERAAKLESQQEED